MSPLWGRDIQARLSSPPAFPDGLEQWGQSGKGQLRSFDNAGRLWQEIYPAFYANSAEGRAFFTRVNQARRERTVWDVQPPWWRTNYGVGGGSPTVDGAGQTGNTINVTGAAPSVTNWLRRGDVVKFDGVQLVFDVAEDADSDSGGAVVITLSPPIFAGQSPNNGAFVETDAQFVFVQAVLVGVELTDIDADGIVQPGLALTWREQPS